MTHPVRSRRIARISGICVAALALGASAAHAQPATLWACHGPTGTPLGVAGLTPATAGDGVTLLEADACTGAGAATAGLTATFSRPDPAGGSSAGWRIDVPAAATLERVSVARSTRTAGGPATESAVASTDATQRYELRTPTTVLESANLFDTGHDLLGMFGTLASGPSVTVEAMCPGTSAQRCAAVRAGAVSVGSVALAVDDSEAPRGAVAGVKSPASGTLQLAVSASDAGVGLTLATATVDGQQAGQTKLGGDACGDLSPGDPAIDLPAGGSCPATVSGVPLAVDLAPYAAGHHQLQVRVADAAGNETVILDQGFDVAGPPPVYTPSVSLQIGEGGGTGGDGTPRPAPSPAPPCLAPRLSMALDQRPLRTTKAGLPVLRAGSRYRFRGRLTCRVNGGRRSAPRGIAVSLVSRLGPGGRNVVSKTGVVTRRAGRLTLIMSYRSNRTMQFSYRSGDGTSTRVRIQIVVSRAKARAAR